MPLPVTYPQILSFQQPQHQQYHPFYPSEADRQIATLECRLAQTADSLRLKAIECDRLTEELHASKTECEKVSAAAGKKYGGVDFEGCVEMDRVVVGLLDGLRKEVEEKAEELRVVRQQLLAASFTTESVHGKRLLSLVSLLESENKSLGAHLSEDSHVEHMRMQLAQAASENQELRCKLKG
ncbi:hypothetical protein HDU98_001080 [Podochytrium sp. JEL0797]|nr:hypothetical protein HDU98_001080 [Podochytrium sp. JEL0797]